jgi:hypothetical protein
VATILLKGTKKSREISKKDCRGSTILLRIKERAFYVDRSNVQETMYVFTA